GGGELGTAGVPAVGADAVRAAAARRLLLHDDDHALHARLRSHGRLSSGRLRPPHWPLEDQGAPFLQVRVPGVATDCPVPAPADFSPAGRARLRGGAAACSFWLFRSSPPPARPPRSC